MKILRMGVDPGGLAFGLDKLSHELHPQQYLRELTQNGIEAIQKTPSKQGEVVWDVTTLPWRAETVEKLCCIDNGIGMSADEMIEYINTSFKSGKEQGHVANFGIGAKVAGLTFNKAGLLYVSWKDGIGTYIHLIQDPDTGEYGLKQLERSGGTYGYWAPASDALKPSLIHRHGTMVILLGNSEADNTFAMPDGALLPSTSWVAYYLNTRFFRVPEGVRIWARLQKDDPRRVMRQRVTIEGQEGALQKIAESEGKTDIGDALVRWWILPPEQVTSGSSSRLERGHIAALYDDELYELVPLSRGGTARLQNFGVLVGVARVVLYVEPKFAGATVEPNLTRTKLLVNREPLPWSRWASAFAENMPKEISEMMDSIFAGAPSADNDRTIRKRLAKIAELLDVHRYQDNPDGPDNAEEDTVGGIPQHLGREKDMNGKTGGLGGLSAALYKLLRSDEAPPAEKKQTRSKYPKVQWVSVSNGRRSPGDMEGRAARYLKGLNLIMANADFVGFEQLVDLLRREIHAPRGLIKEIAELEYETVLTETVMSMHSLDGSKEWSTEEINEALSEEALTTAVMSRFHVYQVVRREAIKKSKETEKTTI